MSEFSIYRHHTGDGTLTVSVAGEVDLATSGMLTAAIREAVNGDHVAELIIDLGRVEFLDSTGITALIVGYRLAEKHGIGYRVTHPRRIVKRILDITGVLDVLTGRAPPRTGPSGD